MRVMAVVRFVDVLRVLGVLCVMWGVSPKWEVGPLAVTFGRANALIGAFAFVGVFVSGLWGII